MPPLNVISLLVENKPGVLFNISNIFRRKGFNIHSITAIAGEDPDTTRITITVLGEGHEVQKLIEQLDKMIDVIKAKRLDPLRTVQRELVLVKLRTSDPMAQEEAIATINQYRGLVVDIKPDTIIAEVTGMTAQINSFLRDVKNIGIIESARTGITALEKGWLTLES
jgi:acetolactate synthase-1/3 small subunit